MSVGGICARSVNRHSWDHPCEETRILGSSTPYNMSTTKWPTKAITPMNENAATANGMSSEVTELIRIYPIPGHEKTVSVMIPPSITVATAMTRLVATGRSAVLAA